MSDKLEPCPFCGTLYVSLSSGRRGESDVFYYVECDNCEAMGPSSPLLPDDAPPEPARKYAVEMWNQRRQP